VVSAGELLDRITLEIDRALADFLRSSPRMTKLCAPLFGLLVGEHKRLEPTTSLISGPGTFVGI
jgi:hypothetical protein